MIYGPPHKIALREFFLFNYTDDCNFATPEQMSEASIRVDRFLLAYEYLKFNIKTGLIETTEQLRSAVYEAGKRGYGDTKEALKEFFADMNLVLFDRKHGPQLYLFIDMLGHECFIEKVDSRISYDYMKLFEIPTYTRK
jgi:lysyl-tRNA synthetase class I